MENTQLESQEPEAVVGSQPSIVEHFSIEGLYGYRTISLSSQYAATILIAKNGSGKTTLLGALDAFLKGQFSRLSGIQFSSIKCKLRGVPDILQLTYEDVLSIVKIPVESKLNAYAKGYGIDPVVLCDFIENEYPALRRAGYIEHEIFNTIESKNGYSQVEAKKVCDLLADSLAGRNPNVDFIRATIKSVVDGIEIVYLPTYRRIELPLSSDVDNEDERYKYGRKKRSVRSLLGIPTRSLFNADIQFGLSDISERLSKLNRQILFNSNQGYREISANIINELLNGAYDRDNPSPEERPDKESLNLFFARLKEGRKMGPFDHVAVPDIDKIYSGEDISDESSKFLTYFLSKLNKVIRATRDVELVVEDFITNCNRYLSVQDKSTSVSWDVDYNSTRPASVDDKILTLDRRNLRVHVESVAAKRRISLESLSSGEKQMISLFARLYLYPGKKIILIDEPELSLSIDWQKKILLDVVSAPSCAQVIAITHSPFVFDNALEPYARSLSLTIAPNEHGNSVGEGDEEDDEDGLDG